MQLAARASRAARVTSQLSSWSCLYTHSTVTCWWGSGVTWFDALPAPTRGRVWRASTDWFLSTFTSHGGGTPLYSFTSHSGGTLLSTFTWSSLHPVSPPPPGWPALEACLLLHGTWTTPTCHATAAAAGGSSNSPSW